jgi:hypothetical protein
VLNDAIPVFGDGGQQETRAGLLPEFEATLMELFPEK